MAQGDLTLVLYTEFKELLESNREFFEFVESNNRDASGDRASIGAEKEIVTAGTQGSVI